MMTHTQMRQERGNMKQNTALYDEKTPKVELKAPYVSVEYEDGPSYGGNQRQHPDPGFQKDGCGVVAGTDWLLYCRGKKSLTADTYHTLLNKLNHSYLPYRKGRGMSGFVFALGMNRYLRRHGRKERFRWGVPRRKLFSVIGEMLAQDLPVVLTAGPKAPWKKKSEQAVTLYQKTADRNYISKTSTRGHYMTVTGMDEQWLRVASWGKEYYISRQEYLDYARHYSFYFFTNVFSVRK